MAEGVGELEATRARVLKRLSEMGDMRRGSVTETYRRCGKATCSCANPEHPGHGPFYAFTRKVDGKTETIQLRPSSELTKLLEEVGTYHDFRRTCEELVEVNERICRLRPVKAEVESGSAERRRLKKKLPRSSTRRWRARSST